MQNLNFDTVNQAWNAIRTGNSSEMTRQIPSLIQPMALILKRVDETPFMMTVMFSGFNQALSDEERGIPMAKKFIVDWMKQFGGQVQIQRGDDSNALIMRITKPSRDPMTPEQPQMESAPIRRGELVNIARVRKVND